MPATFLSLPVEMRLMIRNAIHSDDLRTHVCFYLSSPFCAALYNSERDPDAFWELACWNCGIGLLPNEDIDDVSWRDIAIKCITDDGFCQNPECGEGLLDYNREGMQECVEHVELFEPLRIDDDYTGNAAIGAHYVFSHISFRPEREVNRYQKSPVEVDAYLRVGKATSANTNPDDRAYLSQHPLVARSFAAFAPVSSLLLMNPWDWDLPHDTLVLHRTITVLDLLTLMQMDLDEDLTVRSASEFVSSSHEKCLLQRGWTIKTAFVKLRTRREILDVCPLRLLELAEFSFTGPAFSMVQY